MSKNVKVNGVAYHGVSKLELKAVEGGTVTFVDADEATGGEKILYMDAALLNAGGAYPVDADDYTTAVIPAEATFVDYEAFANLPNLDTLIVIGECEFEMYEEGSGKNLFYYNAITKNDVPIRKLIVSGRSVIPKWFMENSESLVEIAVCGSVDNAAFQGCTNLEKVALGGVNSLGLSAFAGCTTLAEVVIPDSVTEIDSQVFMDCSALKTVTLPNNMTTIPWSMFANTGLTEVSIPDSVTEIEVYAFQYTSLTEITVPNGVTAIRGCAFRGCSNLATVTLPDTLNTIEGSAFQHCTALTEVTIPAGVGNIGYGTFDSCTNLSTITILGMETTIDSGTSEIGTVSIPTTTKIRGYAGSAAETWANENGYTFEAIA